MKQIYEYKIIDDAVDGNPDDEFELNELGKEGWELCAINSSYRGSRRWYFKRRINIVDSIFDHFNEELL